VQAAVSPEVLAFLVAEQEYRDIRRDYRPSDADTIAANVAAALKHLRQRLRLRLPKGTRTLVPQDIRSIKQYLFVQKHRLPVGDGAWREARFDAHLQIAWAWDRLLKHPELIEPSDIVLLLHEREE